MHHRKRTVPSYRLHKASGQAVVTLGGKDHYLGQHDSPESREKYDRLIAEWLQAGRPTTPPEKSAEGGAGATVNHVIRGFWVHAQTHYRHPNGEPTSELDNFRQALRPLRRLFGTTPADEFRPRSLKALRQHMIGLGWARTNINNQIGRIKSVFRWAAEEEMVPGETYQALRAVRGLQRGRTEARETDPIKPAPEHLIQAIEPYVSRQVWAMIQIQRLSGPRPGNVVLLRAIDLDMSGEIWTAKPQGHKTAHHDHDLTIYFGPRAQRVLAPFLVDRPLDAYLFSPTEAEAERLEALHEARKTPLSCGNRPGSNRRKNPKRKASDRYTVNSYRRAITRACDHAFPPPEELARIKVPGKRKRERWETDKEWEARLGDERWKQLEQWQADHRWFPHQLRHNAATEVCRAFGVEVARTVLGQKTLAVTDIYAEQDRAKAERAIRKLG